MDIIIGLMIGLVFFICTITAYTIGLKHGKQIGNNQVPIVLKNPVKEVIKAAENKATAKEEAKNNLYIDNLFSYNGEPQKGIEE